MIERLAVLDSINFDEIDFGTLNKNMSSEDIKKVIAFQIGQTLSLMNGVECYTKSEIGDEIPSLKKYLHREKSNNDDLSKMLNEFINKIRGLNFKDRFENDSEVPHVIFNDGDRYVDINLLTEIEEK